MCSLDTLKCGSRFKVSFESTHVLLMPNQPETVKNENEIFRKQAMQSYVKNYEYHLIPG